MAPGKLPGVMEKFSGFSKMEAMERIWLSFLPQYVSENETWQLVAYLRSFQGV